ncbi:MAG: hypothetical protein ABH896_02380 [Candidatus Jacksonbacteria bacterium]
MDKNINMPQISNEKINYNTFLFEELEKDLIKRIEFYKEQEIVAKSVGNKILTTCLNLSNRTYALFRRDISDYLLNTAKKNDVNEQQYYEIAGMKTCRPFLDIINAFEYITEQLYSENKQLKTAIEEKINLDIEALEKCDLSKANKRKFIGLVKFNGRTQSKKREIFKKLKLINEEDYQFLSFVWDWRNSMHNNFVAHKNIEYKLKDHGLGIYYFNFKKGNCTELKEHPKWIVVIIEKIISIMVKIIQNLKNLSLCNTK